MKFPFFNRKKAAPAKRYYQGAQVGRLLGGMFGSSASADSTIKPSLGKLRDRARDLERNNEYVARALDLMEIGVVGDRGFNLQVKGVNLDNRLDIPANDLIERRWKEWGKYATTDGCMSFRDVCAMAIRVLKRDGEFFAQIVRNSAYSDGIALHPIEADRIDVDKNELMPSGRRIRMGVELDEFERPIAYWVLNYHPGDYDFMQNRPEKKHTRIPAENMIHVFKKKRPGQTRGETAFAPAIFALKMLDGYRDAEITAARAAAAKFGVLVSPGGDGIADSYDGDIPQLDYEAGTIQSLPQGYDLKMIDPTHPTSAFSDFNKAVLRGIASGIGLSYEALSNDLEGTSYSSIRQGALLERDQFKNDQQFMIDHFVDKVFKIWLRWSMETGSLTLNGLSIGIDKYNKFSEAVQWRGRGFQWVDPLKEINAAVVGLQNGILSMQDVANHYGRDVEETFAQIERDKETAAQFGIQTAFEPFGAPKAPVQQDLLGDTE
jgi:lambda family phage portal protein